MPKQTASGSLQKVRSETNVRIGGAAVLTIDYGNYEIAVKPTIGVAGERGPVGGRGLKACRRGQSGAGYIRLAHCLLCYRCNTASPSRAGILRLV